METVLSCFHFIYTKKTFPIGRYLHIIRHSSLQTFPSVLSFSHFQTIFDVGVKHQIQPVHCIQRLRNVMKKFVCCIFSKCCVSRRSEHLNNHSTFGAFVIYFSKHVTKPAFSLCRSFPMSKITGGIWLILILEKVIHMTILCLAGNVHHRK